MKGQKRFEAVMRANILNKKKDTKQFVPAVGDSR